jgi:dihydroxyacetone kinase-like protein
MSSSETISIETISRAVQAVHAAMAGLEQELNAADAKLGDGDTGGMLARVIGKMADVDLSTAADAGTALTMLARAATLATGSSLGTLFATGLLTIGRRVKGQSDIAVDELSEYFAGARNAMMARGGARLGDKTVLDGLDAIARALEGLRSVKEAAEASAAAAESALEEFRGKPNHIGRARMFGDQTIGLDDPGMLAIARLAEILSR